jgi:glycosyltransferase involved in cell wall biosynthesis
MKVLHVITGLGSGGAERMLVNVIGALQQHEHYVLSLAPNDFHLNELLKTTEKVVFVNSRNPLKIIRTIREMFRYGQFDLIQSWMFHADLFSSLALLTQARKRLFWGVQAGELPKGQFGWKIRTIRKLLAVLSSVMCNKVLVCSHNAAAVLERVGYQTNKIEVIHNAVDTTIFCPRNQEQTDFAIPIFIAPARWHPMKDHATLLSAWGMARVAGLTAELHLVGKDMDYGNRELCELVDAFGISDSVVLLGERSDMSDLYNASSFVCLSSQSGEGLPLALCEAMSSGLPPIVTNVGDMPRVVGDSGLVIEARNVSALSLAFLAFGSLNPNDTQKLRTKAREQILSEYSISVSSLKYLEIWKSVQQ